MTTDPAHASGPPRPTPGRPPHHRSPANKTRHDNLPLGARIADRVTAVFGSWSFILIQTALIIIWLSYNGYAAVHYLHSNEFDPYPFILLNLLFPTQAAYAALVCCGDFGQRIRLIPTLPLPAGCNRNGRRWGTGSPTLSAAGGRCKTPRCRR